MTKIFLIEQLTADETDRDYSVIGMTPNFEHAVARCNISELQYRYNRAYDCNGELVTC